VIASRLRAKSAVVALAAASGVVLTTGVVAAATSGPKIYHGCASRTTGSLRLLVGRQHCHLKYERPVTWNKRGPVGFRGLTGFVGPKGPTGDQGPVGPQGVPGVGRPALFYTAKSLVGSTPLSTGMMRVAGLTGLPAGTYRIEANITVETGPNNEQQDHNVTCAIGTPTSPGASTDTTAYPVTGYVRPQGTTVNPSPTTFHEADIWERGEASGPDVYLDCQDPQSAPGATPPATVLVDHVTLVATAIRTATMS
jgi:hypothetical protein